MKTQEGIRTIDSVVNKYSFGDLQVTQNERFVRAYESFKKKYGDCSSALSPCCFLDASPSKVFDNVTYVDTHTKSMNLMGDAGFQAITSDIATYSPKEEHDLLILIKPMIGVTLEDTTKHLVDGGYILTDYIMRRELEEDENTYEPLDHLSDRDPRFAINNPTLCVFRKKLKEVI